MSTLIFLGGMGTGAFVATVLYLVLLRCFARENRTRAEEMHADILSELRRRNELLEEQNAIFAELARETPAAE